VDDVIISHSGANGPKKRDMFYRVRQVAEPGANSAVSDYIVF